jgi:hypothetical protein
MADQGDELNPSDLDVVLAAKTPHAAEVSHYVTKDALMQTALKMWQLSKDIIDDDDGICCAMRDSLEATLVAGQQVYGPDAHRPDPDVLAELEARRPPDSAPRAAKEAYIAELKALARETRAEGLALDAVREAIYFNSLIAYADGQITAIGLARWAENGFPQVTMGHKYCAALLCTGTDAETLAFVKPPWGAFFIEVPPGLLPVDSDVCGNTEVKRILVVRLQNKKKGETWAYIAFTDTFITLWRFGADTSELEPPSIEGEEHFAHLLQSEPFTTQDRRVTTLIGRLIINTCLAMSDKGNITLIGPGHKAYNAARRNGDIDTRVPAVRTFQVGASVKLDLRDDVKTFITHGPRKPGGGAPSVQVTVRGHFKTQRHGPKNTLVKVIWRQPFRRGSKDAPVLVRAHELGKEE